MSNTLGNNLKVTVFGESHGPYIGATIDGLTPGIKIDEEYINRCLELRRPSKSYETQRVEQDKYSIISGVFNGYSTGSPLTIIIPNSNTRSGDYELTKDLARPSHADYVSNVKYNGYQDYRGGGHFSGRITASIVACGAIVLKALEDKGIKISSHILSIGGVSDKKFSNFEEEMDKVNNANFPVISDVSDKMEEVISNIAKLNDSIGGVIETAITGLPVGLGSPMFDSVESLISKAMFAIGAIKGVEFGEGFNFKNLVGSSANDAFRNVDGKVVTETNHNGGVNGGITNGMPVTFNVVVKPTPSISLEQDTINMTTNENASIKVVGRHDPAIIRRVNIVVRAMTALVVGDLLISRYGENALK